MTTDWPLLHFAVPVDKAEHRGNVVLTSKLDSRCADGLNVAGLDGVAAA